MQGRTIRFLIFKDARARYAVLKGRRTRDFASGRLRAQAIPGVNSTGRGHAAVAAVRKGASTRDAPSQQSSESDGLMVARWCLSAGYYRSNNRKSEGSNNGSIIRITSDRRQELSKLPEEKPMRAHYVRGPLGLRQ